MRRGLIAGADSTGNEEAAGTSHLLLFLDIALQDEDI